MNMLIHIHLFQITCIQFLADIGDIISMNFPFTVNKIIIQQRSTMYFTIFVSVFYRAANWESAQFTPEEVDALYSYMIVGVLLTFKCNTVSVVGRLNFTAGVWDSNMYRSFFNIMNSTLLQFLVKIMTSLLQCTNKVSVFITIEWHCSICNVAIYNIEL